MHSKVQVQNLQIYLLSAKKTFWQRNFIIILWVVKLSIFSIQIDGQVGLFYDCLSL